MGLRSYLSLLFCPANRDWKLQSSSPQNLPSLLTHLLTADCTYVACLYFLLWLAIPVPLWYQVVFRKSPAAGTQPICVFSELAFYLSSYAIYFGVFWSSDFVIWSCKPPLQASSCLSLTAYVIHF